MTSAIAERPYTSWGIGGLVVSRHFARPRAFWGTWSTPVAKRGPELFSATKAPDPESQWTDDVLAHNMYRYRACGEV